MKTSFTKHLLYAAIVALAPCSVVLAQNNVEPAVESAKPAEPRATPQATPDATSANFDRAINKKDDWYFSWGYSRQQYAPSDIHISQPGLGNDFTLHKVTGSDFPSSVQDTLSSLVNFDFTNPQENVRIGKFLNPEKTFAIELSIDHSKYNADFGQTVAASGTINGLPAPANMTLTKQNFDYALHNGLNHIMVNAVWLHHLTGPQNKQGQLQLISRAGAGILLPHADVSVFGQPNGVGPKNENICCFKSNDWWQINGLTAGVEVGVRYRVYKSMFLELTSKVAYGVLRNVPVYQGSADQTIWMSEQVLSAGFLF
ncbi:MAG: hypothetical protein RL032_1277 [Pseudomonadota bacterium]|jgi:hypothetical protein